MFGGKMRCNYSVYVPQKAFLHIQILLLNSSGGFRIEGRMFIVCPMIQTFMIDVNIPKYL